MTSRRFHLRRIAAADVTRHTIRFIRYTALGLVLVAKVTEVFSRASKTSRIISREKSISCERLVELNAASLRDRTATTFPNRQRGTMLVRIHRGFHKIADERRQRV